MKKNLIALVLLAVASSAFSMENGEAQNRKDVDNIPLLNVVVKGRPQESKCTSTLIGNQYIITAAHCIKDKSTGAPYLSFRVESDPIEFFGVTTGYNTINARVVADFSEGKRIALGVNDVAILSLDEKYYAKHVNYIADLTRNLYDTNFRVDDSNMLTIVYGYGGTSTLSKGRLVKPSERAKASILGRLSRANPGKTFTDGIYRGYYGIPKGLARMEHGDSGGPWMNIYEELVAVNSYIIAGSNPRVGASSPLQDKADWILNTVNGYQFPSVVYDDDNDGEILVEVQSLDTSNKVDEAQMETGNWRIDGGTCQEDSVEPYKHCTYRLSGNGQDILKLSDEEHIMIRKRDPKPTKFVAPTPPAAKPSSNNDGDGGSFGLAGLLGLLALVRLRRKY